MLFDTHAHLDDEKYDVDRDEVIKNIYDEGISLLVNVGSDMESSEKALELAKKYSFIYAAVGVHPYSAPHLTEEDICYLKEMTKDKKVVAIGEIGLDYHFEDTDRIGQKKGFIRQIELARELDLPYIVHDRDSHQDCYDIIKNSGYLRGVMHCFSGSSEFAKQMVDLGFYISFAGTVTFKNAKKVHEAAKTVPLERLLIETDSPYLAPEPYRGKRNNPLNVIKTLEAIADIKGISIEKLARITMENGKTFFGINQKAGLL